MNELEQLRALAHALGGPAFAQGAGGNVSVKGAGRLFVKASGARLAQTAEPGGHSVVSLAVAERALAGDREAETELFAVRPRPSMETFLHALPARVVVHVHAIGALLAACAPAGAVPFSGVRVAYHAPGRALAVAVRDAAANDGRATLLLASHGVLLLGDDVPEVLERLMALEANVLARFPAAPAFETFLGAYLPTAPGATARVPDRSSPPRILFPDAVVYAPRVEVDDTQSATASGLLVDPAGVRRVVARSPEALRGVCEIVAAHDWVEDALVGAGITPLALTDDQIATLRADPAEAYRQQRGRG